MSGTLELSAGPGGLGAGPFPAELGVTLGIGDTERVSIALDEQLPDGPWDARIASCGAGSSNVPPMRVITFPDHRFGDPRGHGLRAGPIPLPLASACSPSC